MHLIRRQAALMPELPEVENLARCLAPWIPGCTVDRVRFYPSVAGLVNPDPDCLPKAVRGRRIEGLRRHGKYLFVLFEGDVSLAVHLRMTGQLLLLPVERPVDKHTHIELLLSAGRGKLVFRDVRRLGRLQLLDENVEQFVASKGLGADALDIPAEELHRSLRRTSRGVKAALLDQGTIAGLGNIYIDEILFRERISPLRRAQSLSLEEVASLRRTIRSVLRSAISKRGTTISDYVDARGEEGSFQDFLLVYSRAGKPCRRCGATIVKSRVAGRGTYTCPSCQAGT